MNNEAICKTYVRHQDRWFFVSTIERESSAPIVPSPTYWETIVWEYNYDTGERGKLLFMDAARVGDLEQHQTIVKDLFKTSDVNYV